MPKHTPSIISNEPCCIVCGITYGLHRHHCIYGRGRRQLSEKYGLWVYLCARHHNASNAGVHFNHNFDTKLKQICQKKWEEKNGTREDFIKLFGRNYLEVDE